MIIKSNKEKTTMAKIEKTLEIAGVIISLVYGVVGTIAIFRNNRPDTPEHQDA